MYECSRQFLIKIPNQSKVWGYGSNVFINEWARSNEEALPALLFPIMIMGRTHIQEVITIVHAWQYESYINVKRHCTCFLELLEQYYYSQNNNWQFCDERKNPDNFATSKKEFSITSNTESLKVERDFNKDHVCNGLMKR